MTPEALAHRRARKRITDARWRQTENGRAVMAAAQARYRASEKGRARIVAAAALYRKTEKGRAIQRASHARYSKTEKGRAAKAARTVRYRQTERGHAVNVASVARWRQSEKGRAALQRYRRRPSVVEDLWRRYHERHGPVPPRVLDALRTLRDWKRYLATGDPTRPIPKESESKKMEPMNFRSDQAPELGSWIRVYRFRRWRAAKVLEVGRTRALVQYLIPRGVKRVREAWVPFYDLRVLEQ